jgi:hypothetical protein
VPITNGPKTSPDSWRTISESPEIISNGPETTPEKLCHTKEYIDTLIATGSVEITPNDLSNKEDLITKGADCIDKKPSFLISIPKGALVRDMKINSYNLVQVEVIFTLVSGHETVPISGSPTSLPTNKFPEQRVNDIVIKVIETTDDEAPKGVTLSVTICAEGMTTATSAGKWLLIASYLNVNLNF